MKAQIEQALRELADQLADDASWDDVMEQIYVRQKIAAGLKDVEEGRLLTDEEVVSGFCAGERC